MTTPSPSDHLFLWFPTVDHEPIHTLSNTAAAILPSLPRTQTL